MPNVKKRRLTDGIEGEQSENPPGSVSNARLQDVGGKKKLTEVPKAQTQIGGYDTVKEGGTVTLGRAMQEQKTKEVMEAIIERERKRLQKK